jgi:hypothetical protein
MPFHRIALSALASTFGGMITPICLAVFRLITNSNFDWLLDGKISRLCAFQDLVDARRGAPL